MSTNADLFHDKVASLDTEVMILNAYYHSAMLLLSCYEKRRCNQDAYLEGYLDAIGDLANSIDTQGFNAAQGIKEMLAWERENQGLKRTRQVPHADI